MSYLEIIFIGIGLSMDALAVSILNGYLIKSFKHRYAFRIAFFFGFFQAIMPLFGFFLGSSLFKNFQKFDHIIAFLILLFLGLKMIYNSKSFEKDACDIDNRKDCLNFSYLILMSFATSIDAFAVGISFAILKLSIWAPIIIIGFITFIICLVGVYVGKRIGHFFESKMEILGGSILIVIGLKILIEHLIKKI